MGERDTTLATSSLPSALLAGATGSVLGMLLAELLKNPSSIIATPSASQSGAAAGAPQYGLWMAIFGAVLGATLLAWPAIAVRDRPRALREGGQGVAIGAVAGFAGGYLDRRLFASILDGIRTAHSAADWKFRLAGAVATAVFGGLLGLGWGARHGLRAAVERFLGGAFGGAFAGFIAKEIWLSGWIDSPFWFRLVTLVLTGVLVAFGICFLDTDPDQRPQTATH